MLKSPIRTTKSEKNQTYMNHMIDEDPSPKSVLKDIPLIHPLDMNPVPEHRILSELDKMEEVKLHAWIPASSKPTDYPFIAHCVLKDQRHTFPLEILVLNDHDACLGGFKIHQIRYFDQPLLKIRNVSSALPCYNHEVNLINNQNQPVGSFNSRFFSGQTLFTTHNGATYQLKGDNTESEWKTLLDCIPFHKYWEHLAKSFGNVKTENDLVLHNVQNNTDVHIGKYTLEEMELKTSKGATIKTTVKSYTIKLPKELKPEDKLVFVSGLIFSSFIFLKNN